MKKLIETLVGIPSACGHEQDVIRYLRDYLCSNVDSWEIDGIGNLIVKKEGGKPGPTLMVSAHSDEVGFIVKKIEDAISKFCLVFIGDLDPEEFSEWLETTDIETDVKQHLVVCSRLIRQRNKKDVREMLNLFLDRFEPRLKE